MGQRTRPAQQPENRTQNRPGSAALRGVMTTSVGGVSGCAIRPSRRMRAGNDECRVRTQRLQQAEHLPPVLAQWPH